MIIMQNRFRSKTAWATLLALILFVAKTYFNVEIPEANTLVDFILLTAAGLGIFNDPTNKDGF
jgi:uncharacterized membrane protein